jgi:hypothetical protein
MGVSMNPGLLVTALALLSGCTKLAIRQAPDDVVAEQSLKPVWIAPDGIEIQLDGKQYNGTRTSHRCVTDACRGDFRNVPRIYRRHIEQGQASLTARDGSSLDCAWVSYLPEADGYCRAQDGRVFN